MADSSLGLTPFHEIPRRQWAALASELASPLNPDEIDRVRGLGDPLDLAEVEAIYVPLTRLLHKYVDSARRTHADTAQFLGITQPHTPFIIGVAGSVAVGKSTVSRLLRELLARDPQSPHIALVTTDGFLFPNDELERRGILDRKGFPESYDRRSLLRFVTAVKSGAARVTAPIYSHLSYDIVPDEVITVERPDILIVEGLNVLQPPSAGQSMALSDLFDFSIYVDARTSDIEAWFINRFLALQEAAFADKRSYFHQIADLSRDDAVALATRFWREVNEPNLVNNIAPTRPRATLVLKKDHDHTVSTVLLRKI